MDGWVAFVIDGTIYAGRAQGERHPRGRRTVPTAFLRLPYRLHPGGEAVGTSTSSPRRGRPRPTIESR